MKKGIALLICLTLICTIIISCSEKTENSGANTENNGNNVIDDTDPYNTDYLPDYNLKGREFNILTWGYPDGIRDQGLGNWFYADEENGDSMNDAIYARNMVVSERFNLKIKNTFSDNLAYIDKLNATVMANDKEFDLFVLSLPQNAQIALAGNMIINWNEVKCIDLDKPWWNQNIRELIEINNYLPFMVSDYLYSSLVTTYAMIYSKNMLENYGIESIYKLVDDGKWTFDKFYNIIKPLTRDVNGDGKMDDEDQYGFSTASLYLNSFSFGMGIRTVTLDKNDVPVLTVYNEKSVYLVEKLHEMFNVEKLGYFHTGSTICPIPWETDRIFIQNILLSDLNHYRSTDADFGIIPYPKWDEIQEEYYTYADAMGGAIGIPIYSDDIEIAGAVVEALSAESRRTVLPAYYERTLNTKFVRDEDSLRMLDIIFDGRVYDFGFVYRTINERITSYPQTCYTNKNSNFTSYYEANKDMWTAWFDDIYTIYMERIK